MRVIKLGGSLSQKSALIHCLDTIEQRYAQQPVIIVPGGGAFADQVRLAQTHWQFDDTTAHQMAILAMQQMALLIKGLKPQFTLAPSINAFLKPPLKPEIWIWSPSVNELNEAGIAASWKITSDSLAAWLAKTIEAKSLTLVKSAVIDQQMTLQDLTNLGIIDAEFCKFTLNTAFSITVIHHNDF